MKQILVVDDDTDIREVLTDTLTDEGFPADAVSNGQEALEILRGSPPHPRVILLDLMMPVMDGLSFLKVREADPEIATIPVIVLTAAGRGRDLLGAYDVRACLAKPFALTSLLTAIAACV